MAGLGQYLQETRSELRHVAWPTRTQTIVYTVMVALLSVGVSLYLGLFDYIFTSGLSRALQVLPAATPVTITQQPAASTSNATLIPMPTLTPTPKAKGPSPNFNIPAQQ